MSIDNFTTIQHGDSAVPTTTQKPATHEENGFAALNLADSLLRAIAGLGYTQPTTVQTRVMPLAMQQNVDKARYDLMVTSQTGSGKTAAFLLPVLQRLIEQQTPQKTPHIEDAPKKSRRKNPRNQRRSKQPVQPKALIVCPTRELAQQVMRDAVSLVRYTDGMHIASVVGGLAYGVQLARLQNANVVVATPGRLLDLYDSGYLRLDSVQYMVLDEADRMLDLGFSEALARIHELTQKRQQTLMFSATFAPRIQRLALDVMRAEDAVQRIQIDTPQQRHTNITQKLYWADNYQHRHALLDYWLRDSSIDQAIVFSNTQVECDTLAQNLQENGYSAAALHGGLNQSLRNRRLKSLRDGKIQILVATDVAARGIDVSSITHVFNMGLPMNAEDYTHRIGRTGRAGRNGVAVTIAEFRDRRRMRDVEYHTKQTLKAEVIAGLEPTQRERDVRRKKPSRPSGQRARKGGARQGAESHGRYSDSRNNSTRNTRNKNSRKSSTAHAAAKKPRSNRVRQAV